MTWQDAYGTEYVLPQHLTLAQDSFAIITSKFFFDKDLITSESC